MDKKELKKQYKQTSLPMGIFQIKNTGSGKVFLCKSKNLIASSNREIFILKHGSHSNGELQADFNKYGKANFVFEIVDILEPKEDPLYKYNEDLQTLELLWLEKIQPCGEKGYNKKK